MPKNCVVPTCVAARGRVPPFHVFPNPNKDPDRFNDWVKAIGGDLSKIDPLTIYRTKRICNVHFEEMFYVRNNRLSNISVPTLHMRRVINSELDTDGGGTQEEGIEPIFNSQSVSQQVINIEIEPKEERQAEGIFCETQVIETQSDCSAVKEHDYIVQIPHMENVTVYVPEYVCPDLTDQVVAFEEIIEGDCEDITDDLTLEHIGDDRCMEGSYQMDALQSPGSVKSEDCEENTDELTLEHIGNDRCMEESDQMVALQSAGNVESEDCEDITEDLTLEHIGDEMCMEGSYQTDALQSPGSVKSEGNTVNENSKEELQSTVCKVICDGRWKKENDAPNSIRPTRILSTADISKERSAEKRGIQKLTSTELKLYLRLLRDIHKLKRITQLNKKRAMGIKFAVDITRNPQYLTILETSESRYKLKRMITAKDQQTIEHDKTKARYSLQQKITSLTIFKHTPVAYHFLKEPFHLPSIDVVKNFISRNETNAGINLKTFKQLKNLVRRINKHERLCVLLYDEVCLRVDVKLNADVLNREAVFPEYVRERKCDNINYGQVFIIRGLLTNYVQPVSYSFSEEPLAAKELSQKIKTVVTELQKAGAIVVSMIVDRNDVKLQALDILKHETRCSYIMNGKEPIKHVICINGREIVPLHDPPTLLKCVRNNMLTKNLQYSDNLGVKVAKWEHIAMLYNEKPGYQGASCVPDLTESHVVAEKIPLGSTKNACQVFSRTVGAYMGFMAEIGVLPHECTGTARAILFFNKLFDSQNGVARKKPRTEENPLLRPVTPVSRHHHIWNEARKMFETMKFVDPTTGANIDVNVLRDWSTSLDSTEFLLKRLVQRYQITSIWMGQLNQDPLESFFEQIRSEKCTNDNPLNDRFDDSTSLVVNRVFKVYKVRTKE